jgi:hypothetical protein
MTSSDEVSIQEALADLTHAATAEHEQASRDERDAAFEPLGDVLTSRGYAAWRRSEEEDE